LSRILREDELRVFEKPREFKERERDGYEKGGEGDLCTHCIIHRGKHYKT